MIDLLVYLVSITGSFSIGYSVLRIGWPKTQDNSAMEKICYGFALGLPIVAISAAVSFNFGIKYFFFMFGSLYALFVAVALTRRLSFGEKDSAKLQKKKRIETIPEKILSSDQKFEHSKYGAGGKEQVFKEEKTNIFADLKQRVRNFQHAREEEKKKALARLKEAAMETLKRDEAANKKMKNSGSKKVGMGEDDETIGEDINVAELEKINDFE
ncbi:MAG: hypothetical protein NTZ73_01240 [Candidatus Diapherotrites archaeon]|nr:hypothetical protein [Candidatus Diapherotrites archaeon]